MLRAVFETIGGFDDTVVVVADDDDSLSLVAIVVVVGDDTERFSLMDQQAVDPLSLPQNKRLPLFQNDTQVMTSLTSPESGMRAYTLQLKGENTKILPVYETRMIQEEEEVALMILLL